MADHGAREGTGSRLGQVVKCGAMSEHEHARYIKLLEDTHEFPGEYPLTVIIVNETSVRDAVRAAIDAGLRNPLPDAALEIVSSRGARYLSLRFTVRVPDAEAVLALHARVKVVAGVIRVM